MQKFLSKYGLAAHLSLLAVAPLFLFPFFGDGTIGAVVMWLTLIAALWLFLEPSRLPGEILHESRTRVFYSVILDPVCWVAALVVVYAAFRWLNGGVRLAFDSSKTVWYLEGAHIPALPGSADGKGFLPFALSLSTTVLVAAARNALGKSARTAALFFISFFAGLAAFIFAFCAGRGNNAILLCMSHSWLDPSFAGSLFGIAMICGLAALAGMLERGWNKLLILYSAAAGFSALGLVLFTPPAVVAVYLAAGLLTAVVSMVFLFPRFRAQAVMKYFAGFLCAVAVASVSLVFVAPEGSLPRLDFLLGKSPLLPDGFSALREALTAVARESWVSASWAGQGIGSFPVNARLSATPELWTLWGGVLPSGVANGWIFMLAERGLAGMVSVAIVGGFMLFTYVRRLVLAIGNRPFIPLAAIGPVAVLALAAETFLTIPRFEMFAIVAFVFGISSSSFPVRRQVEGEPATKPGDSGNG